MAFPPTFTSKLWFVNKCVGFFFFKGKKVSKPTIYKTIQNISIYVFTHSQIQEKRVWNESPHTDYAVTPPPPRPPAMKEEEESEMAGETKEDADFILHGTRGTDY